MQNLRNEEFNSLWGLRRRGLMNQMSENDQELAEELGDSIAGGSNNIQEHGVWEIIMRSTQCNIQFGSEKLNDQV